MAWPILVGAALLSLWAMHTLANWLKIAPNYNSTSMLASNILPYLWVFLVGSTVALSWPRFRWLFAGKALYWIAACGAMTGLNFVVFGTSRLDVRALGPLMILRLVLLGGVVLSCAYTLRSLARVLRGNDLSYGLYLYHMPVIATLSYAGIKGHWWLWPMAIGLPLVLAVLSWFWVEKPALALKGRVWVDLGNL